MWHAPACGHVSQELLPASKYAAQGSCGLRLAAQKQAAVGNLWAGWVRAPVRHGVERADLTQFVQLHNLPVWWGGEFSTSKVTPTYRLPGGVPNKRAMGAVPSALAPVPHDSVFSHVSLVPPRLLTLCQSPG